MRLTKFGIMLPLQKMNLDTHIGLAKEAERAGYEFAMVADHFLASGYPPGTSNMEGWTALTAIGAQTTKIRLGTLVTCVPFRHPSILAKMATNFDMLTGGRLELGLGTGWFGPEFESIGIPFLEPKERIKQLNEALTVLIGLWTQDHFDFAGNYYQIRNLSCNPKPLQKPHPNIWIGTQLGGPSIMKSAARFAQVLNFGNVAKLGPAEIAEKDRLLGQLCTMNNRNDNAVKISCTRLTVIRSREEDALAEARKYAGIMDSLDELRGRRFVVGTPSQVTEQVAEYLKSGVEYFVADFPRLESENPDLEQTRLFAEKIIPSLKASLAS